MEDVFFYLWRGDGGERRGISKKSIYQFFKKNTIKIFAFCVFFVFNGGIYFFFNFLPLLLSIYLGIEFLGKKISLVYLYLINFLYL